MDDYPSPSEVTILHIQDWISSDVGIWCFFGVVLVRNHTMTIVGFHIPQSSMKPMILLKRLMI